MFDQLLSDRDVEKITGRAQSTLQKDRVAGKGIPFCSNGPSCSIPAIRRQRLRRIAGNISIDIRSG
jgi:hypothetical protein